MGVDLHREISTFGHGGVELDREISTFGHAGSILRQRDKYIWTCISIPRQRDKYIWTWAEVLVHLYRHLVCTYLVRTLHRGTYLHGLSN